VRRFFKSWEAADQYRREVAGPGGFLAAEKNRNQDKQVESSTAKPLDLCVRDWLARVYENNPDVSRDRHSAYVQAHQITAVLAKRFGNKPIDLVTHDDLDVWIKGLKLSPMTRHNYWSITARFFRWCHERADLIAKNPMLKVDAPKVSYTPPEILTPDQMGICLQTADGNPEHMAWLCLGGFAGIRSEEIYRMDWADINWVDGIINVRKPKKVFRWRPRVLEEEHPNNGAPNTHFFQALRRHLEPMALRRGLITKEKRAEELRVRVSMMMDWKQWPHNCLRHSFASYHVAVEKNFPKLQELMGHADARLTKYIYSIAIPRTEGERWWNL
jgi:integrase